MKEGLLLLSADGSPEFATPRTCELFGCASLDELRDRWSQLGDAFRSALRANGPHLTRIDVDVPSADPPRRLRLDVHRTAPGTEPQPGAHGGADGNGFAAIVHDRDLLDAVDTDSRLAAQLRTLSRLSASIAHDLKSPLAAVLLHLELLRGTLDNDESERQASRDRRLRYVGIMKDELGRLNRSLTSLFTQTTLRGDTSETFDLRELLHELEFLIRPRAKRQSVGFELSPGDRPASIHGHRDAMKHAILNVAVNALDAMPDGGRLQIGLELKNDVVTIAVRDTGAGVDDAALPNIFDQRFTTKPNACGMGLYVARSVLDLHGGAIRYAPAAQGACFELDVPAAAVDA